MKQDYKKPDNKTDPGNIWIDILAGIVVALVLATAVGWMTP